MNKILLELTEKEAGIVKEALALKHLEVSSSKIGFTEKERLTNYIKSSSEKLQKALAPRQDLVITSQDFFDIKCSTKKQYSRLPAILNISNKKVEQADFIHISIAQALVMWLNSKDVLKNAASFDFTDDSVSFEELD